jgi:RNA polymerase sigma-70 factor, ECF subfamily
MGANLQAIDEIELPHRGQDSENSNDTDPTRESVLVRRAQAGDEKAFSLLLQPYLRMPYHVALRITGNREDAEDASQQSLLKAYMHINQFQGDSQFSTWLTRISINEALMKLRKRRSEEAYMSHHIGLEDEPDPIEALPAGDEMHPEVLFLKWENQCIVRKSIEGLRSASRAVVWLLAMQERKIKETAAILGLSESAAKSRFMRARQPLREGLADQF